MSETTSGADDVAAETLVREIAIVNRRGLHARQVARRPFALVLGDVTVGHERPPTGNDLGPNGDGR